MKSGGLHYVKRVPKVRRFLFWRNDSFDCVKLLPTVKEMLKRVQHDKRKGVQHDKG